MNVTTEYFCITGLNIPRYSEKLKLFRSIMNRPHVVLSVTPDPPALFKIKNRTPQRLKITPPAFCQLRGSFNAIAAMNIV